jgi:hypothetical protein
MLSTEETNAVVRGQLLGYYYGDDIAREEEYDLKKAKDKNIWIRCSYASSEFLGDVTPIAVSPASTCTLLVNSGTNYDIPSHQHVHYRGKISLGDASNTDRFEVELEVLSPQQSELQWVEFCRGLFPGYRDHTIEERQAYSDFIDSFFEEVEL